VFRHFGALVGAIALLNLLKDFLAWQQNFSMWLDAFRSVTRPVASLLFGWMPALVHLSFPGWAKDYLTVGEITALTALRARSAVLGGLGFRVTRAPGAPHAVLGYLQSAARLLILSIVLWPCYLIAAWYVCRMAKQYRSKQAYRALMNYVRAFAAVYVYAILLVVVNYVFIAAGSLTGV
jgi:hypothetical protein